MHSAKRALWEERGSFIHFPLPSLTGREVWLPERLWGLRFCCRPRSRVLLLQVAAMFAVPFKFHLEWIKFRCQARSRLTAASKTRASEGSQASNAHPLLLLHYYAPYNVFSLALTPFFPTGSASFLDEVLPGHAHRILEVRPGLQQDAENDLSHRSRFANILNVPQRVRLWC